MEALGGTLSIIVVILALFLAILALLMPWFVYQIRNQTQDMGQKMDVMIKLLARQSGVTVKPKVKVCPSCGAKNRTQDHVCVRCGKALP